MAPKLRLDARIAIMGAGCAGLTCAEELRERGYRHVTIFEAQRRAGGKIRSVAYDDAPPGGRGLFEAGTVFFIPSPMWTKLLRRYAVSEERTFMPRVRVADVASGASTHLLRFSGGYSAATRVRQIARLATILRRIGRGDKLRAGVAPHVTPDLCASTREWFDTRDLGYVRDVVLPIAAGAQFGPLIDSVPVIYVLRLLALLGRYSIGQQVSRRMPQLRAGHQTLWTRMAATHDVRYGQPIVRISIDRRITVQTQGGDEHFDALIVAAPTDAYLRAATHLADDERAWLGQARTLRREVITARVSGLAPGIFYALRYGNGDAVPPSHPSLFYQVDRGADLHTFHAFTADAGEARETEAAIGAVVARFGGRVESIEHRAVVRGWFPHFTTDALRAGAYARLEDAQGRRNVWLAGELFAGIGVPHGMEYAAAVVRQIAGDHAA